MLNIIVVTTFISSVLLCIALTALHKWISPKSVNTNPQFYEFQKSYFLAFFPALFADWLNAPYLYKLFADYGFLEEQIAIIYVCGLASALIFGTPAGYLVERFGVRKLSLGTTAAYSLACFFKLSPDYSTLIVSRILSGASTILLFAAHESWYSKGHIEQHDFPREWIDLTTTYSAFASAIMAAIAGVLAYFITELYGFGPVAPSLLSVPFLALSAYMTFTHWGTTDQSIPEKEGLIGSPPAIKNVKTPRFVKTCCEGLQNIAQNPDLFLIGCLQSLFESVLCLFVFLWTPVLDHHHPPLGIVFATFMIATLCGGMLYKLLVGWRCANHLLTGTLAIACLAILGCVISTGPTSEFPVVSYLSFLLFEISVGGYFPAMSRIRRLVKPELQNFGVTAWFRVPLNLLACFGLLLLHHSTNASGTRTLFIVCLTMVAIATVLSLRLQRIRKSDEESRDTKDAINMDVL